MEDLYDTFHRNFGLLPVNSRQLLDEALGLRYQVYCIENSYEDAERCADGKEWDGFDWRSVHTLVYHRQSRIFVGTVRLVLPDRSDPVARFPIETHSEWTGGGTLPDGVQIPRDSTAEISRFAVSKDFKRRIAEYKTAAGVSDKATYVDSNREIESRFRRLLPHITLGLFAAIVRMSAQHGITHWYAVMEPTLLRLLTRFGIRFQTVGPLINFHGERQPTVGVIDDVLAGIYKERPDVWDIITDRGRIWPLDRRAVRPSFRMAASGTSQS